MTSTNITIDDKLSFTLHPNLVPIFEEIRKEYKLVFGIDMFDKKNKKKDIKEELKYWKNENDKIGSKINPSDSNNPIGENTAYLLNKLSLIQNFYTSLLQEYDRITTEDDQKTKKRLEVTANIAEELYSKIKDKSSEVPSPASWIYNQNIMRKIWEEFYSKACNNPEPLRSFILGNAYSRYMKFMYDSYPPGFGDEILKSYNKI